MVPVDLQLHASCSSDGSEFLVTGQDNIIQVYESVSLLFISSLSGHSSGILSCHANSDNNYAISGDTGGAVILWDIEAGAPLIRLQASKAPLVSCDLSADCSRAYTLDSEGHAHVWYLDNLGIFDVMQRHTDLLTCCELMKDGSKMVVGYSDGSLRLWSLGLQSTQLWIQPRHGAPVECLSIHEGNGIVASACRDGHIFVSSLSDGQTLADVTAHSGPITSLAFSGSGHRLLSSCRDNTLILWNLEKLSHGRSDSPGDTANTHPAVKFSQVHEFTGPDHCDGIAYCGINPSGSLIAAACNSGHVMIWNTFDRLLVSCIKITKLKVSFVRFSQEGRYVLAGSSDGYVTVIEAATGAIIRHFQSNSSGVTGAFIEDGEHGGKDLTDALLVSVCGRQAVTWQLKKPEGTVLHSAGEIRCVISVPSI